MKILPEWISNYKRSYLKSDIIAGLTVGIMIIPQGMAYAMLAGLPPVYGLYAATVPLFIYAIFGSSRQLSVGPVAIDSMLIAAYVGVLAIAGSQQYISLAILLGFIVGFLQLTVGALRLGFLIKFLSHPVILGFTSAAAIIVGISQLKHLLGIDMTSSPYLQDVLRSLFDSIQNIHYLTMAIGLSGIICLLVLKKLLPNLPGSLFMIIVATTLAGILDLDTYGVKVMGAIPSGIPKPEIPYFDFRTLKQLLPAAFAISLIGFMESLAIAKSIQTRHKNYKVNTNQELLALGLANMMGSVFKSFPVSGGFSRSAVNEQAGAQTGFSSIISAILVIAVLLFLTPLLYFLPNAILASIILVAVIRLIHVKEVKYLWQVDRKDFLMMFVTFLGTLFFGIGTGIGIGVLLSLAWIIFEASYPHTAELGRVPGTHIFRNVKRFKELVVEDDILIFRFDAQLFFANADRFRDILLHYIASRKPKLRAIIVDMESTNTIDTSAITIIGETVEEVKKENVALLLTEVKGPVRDKFFRSGLTNKIGEENFFATIEDALYYLGGKKIDTAQEIALQANK